MDRSFIHATSTISEDATIGDGCFIGPGARIYGNVVLGKGVRAEANAVLYGPSIIGAYTYIGANSVVGFPPKAALTNLLQSGETAALRARPTVIGDGCIIRSGCTVYLNTKLGKGVSLGHNAVVREAVEIGDFTLVGTGVVIDGSTLVGKHVSMQTGAYICANSKIEDYVFLGPHCVLTNDKYLMQKEAPLAGPVVKRGASIGANALLMPNITVGEESMVGAQALVLRDIPARTIAVGVPAKPVKPVPEGWRPLLLERCIKAGCHPAERLNTRPLKIRP